MAVQKLHSEGKTNIDHSHFTITEHKKGSIMNVGVTDFGHPNIHYRADYCKLRRKTKYKVDKLPFHRMVARLLFCFNPWRFWFSHAANLVIDALQNRLRLWMLVASYLSRRSYAYRLDWRHFFLIHWYSRCTSDFLFASIPMSFKVRERVILFIAIFEHLNDRLFSDPSEICLGILYIMGIHIKKL